MGELSGTTIILGALLAMVYVPLVFLPGKMRVFLKAFPRNRWAGGILAAIDLAWAGWLLYVTPMAWFEAFKPWLFILVPVALVLVIVLMGELLAPRALGGLLLLAPAPLLDAAFMVPSRVRLVVVVIAYIMAIEGMVLVLSPYQFRKIVAYGIRTDGRCRAWGLAGFALGVAVIALGVIAF